MLTKALYIEKMALGLTAILLMALDLSATAAAETETPLSNFGGSNICSCTKELQLVCGKDGVSYDNPCLATCAGTNITCKRRCPCFDAGDGNVCSCTKQLQPVCGMDGVSYDNPCLAACAGTNITCVGRCPCSDTGGDDLCLCTQELRWACGVDGASYSNPCHAKCAKVDVACMGPCPCDGTTGVVTAPWWAYDLPAALNTTQQDLSCSGQRFWVEFSQAAFPASSLSQEMGVGVVKVGGMGASWYMLNIQTGVLAKCGGTDGQSCVELQPSPRGPYLAALLEMKVVVDLMAAGQWECSSRCSGPAVVSNYLDFVMVELVKQGKA